MSLAERRWLRLFTLCVLYVAQGIPWGFTATTIPAYLGEQGLAPEAIGIALATTTLPYSFKWVWGPIIDAFTIPRFGRRRPWIVFAQLMMAVTILALIAIPDLTVDLKLLAWMILIHTVFNSLQDVAVDALALDLLDDKERGRANGLMYASKYGGGFIGGAGLSAVIHRFDFQTALIVQTAILLAIMLVPLLVHERRGTVPQRPKFGAVMRSLAEVFAIRSVFVTALLVLGIYFSLGVLTANGNALFTQQLGWSAEKYTRLTGGFGLGAGLAGAVAGGFLADRVGRRRLAGIASIAMAMGWLVFGLAESAWSNDVFVYSLSIFETLCTSVMTVSLFALCMEVGWPPIAASQFTAYMALMNFSTTLGYRFTAQLPEGFDFRTCYLAAAVVQVAVTSLLLWIDPSQTRRTLPRAEGAPIPRTGVAIVVGLLVVLAALTAYVVSGFF